MTMQDSRGKKPNVSRKIRTGAVELAVAAVLLLILFAVFAQS